MKILICDQQLMLAEALAAALDARGYDVLAVTTTVSSSCNAAGDCVPDVCLLGLHAGKQLNGLDTVRVILRRYPGTKVLVLSDVTTPEMLSQLIKSGVAGVTHLGQSVAQIAETLDATEAGQDVLNPGPLRAPARDTDRLAELSPREKEILARIAVRAEHQADVVRHDHHRRYRPHLCEERAHETRGAQPAASSPPSRVAKACSSIRRWPRMLFGRGQPVIRTRRRSPEECA